MKNVDGKCNLMERISYALNFFFFAILIMAYYFNRNSIRNSNSNKINNNNAHTSDSRRRQTASSLLYSLLGSVKITKGDFHAFEEISIGSSNRRLNSDNVKHVSNSQRILSNTLDNNDKNLTHNSQYHHSNRNTEKIKHTNGYHHNKHHSVLDYPPISSLRTSYSKNASLYAHMFWEVSKGVDGEEGNLGLRRGKLKLIVDVGLLFGSALVKYVHEDPNIALLGFEVHPINFGVSYLSTFSKQDLSYKDRISILPLGLSNTSGLLDFKINYSDACGSILESKSDAWWCSHTSGHIAVPVVRLDSMLELLDTDYEFYYLKVDVEGADLHVLDGAGSYLEKFEMVSCEVQNDPNQATRDGANTEEATVSFMLSKGFKGYQCSYKECIFTRHNTTESLNKVSTMQNLAHNGTNIDKRVHELAII